MKVVINRGYGELELSNEAIRYYADLADIDLYYTDDPTNRHVDQHYLISLPELDKLFLQSPNIESYLEEVRKVQFDLNSIERTDPRLIHVIEELGQKASIRTSEIVVVEIPDKIKFKIIVNEDGAEEIHEDHRVWK